MQLEITERKLAGYGTALLILTTTPAVLEYLPEQVAFVLGLPLYVPSWALGRIAHVPSLIPDAVLYSATAFVYYLAILTPPAILHLRRRWLYWSLVVLTHILLSAAIVFVVLQSFRDPVVD